MTDPKKAPVADDPYASLPSTEEDPYATLPDSANLTTEESEHQRLLKEHAPYMTPAEMGHTALRALPTIGGVAGGIIGGAAGAPSGPGAIAAGAFGAGLGGMFGEGLRRDAENLIFKNPSVDKQELFQGMATQGVVQAANDATGRTLGLALSPAMKYLGVTAAAAKASGINRLPSEVAGAAPSTGEKLVKGSIFTTKMMDRFRIFQNAQTKAAVEKAADTIATFKGTPEELGKLMQSQIEQHTAEFHRVENLKYAEIDKLVDEQTTRVPVPVQVPSRLVDYYGNPITTTEFHMMEKTSDNLMPSREAIVDFATNELKKINAARGAAGVTPESAYETTLRGIVDNPDTNATYQGMSQARSKWLAMARDMKSGLSGPEKGFVKKMAKLADQSMMDAAEKSGIPGLPEQIREANAFVAKEHTMFSQALVKKVVATKNPEKITALLLSKPIGLEETRNLFEILPQAMHGPVQKQILLDTMQQSVDPVKGLFNEANFAKSILSMGDERGAVIFGNNWKNIRELSQIMGTINGPLGMGGGGGAALQNAGFIKTAVLTPGRVLAGATGAPLLGVATGHAGAGAAAAGLEALGIATYAGALKAFAAAITHPETAVKVLNAARLMMRGVPYTLRGVYDVTGEGGTDNPVVVKTAQGVDKAISGVGKVTQGLNDIRDKYATK